MYLSVLGKRLYVLAALGLVRGSVDGIVPFVSQDIHLFSQAGQALLAGRLGEVFIDKVTQVGPIQLALFGMNRFLSLGFGYPIQMGITVSTSIGFTVALVLVCRTACRSIGRDPTPGFEMFLGLVALLGGLSYEVATSSHPAEGFIPLLWVLAAVESRRGRASRAGLLLGVAAAMKLWGALGIPLLLLNPSLLKVVQASLVQVAASAAAYLPFAIAGGFNTFGLTWSIKPQSPLRLLMEPGTIFTWKMRLVQSAFIVAGGIVAALFARRSERGFWVVPLVLVALRYLSDPLDYHYYWVSAGVIGLVAFASHVTYEPSWMRSVAAAGFYATLLPFYVMKGLPLALWITTASAGLVAIAAVQLAAETGRRDPVAP